ncbi:MAG: DNA replication/repair protein RecF [Coprobacillus sp.]|nr:DNA replication/repair protein RecF [Coprobacillus sp.]
MIIESLKIKNFRSHELLECSFSNKINVFTGPNGVGKTNILEALYYLSLGRSFLTTDSTELIKNGTDEAVIDALISEDKLKRHLKVVITKEGRRVFVNNKPIKKLSELSGIVNILLFVPSDVDLFRGSPSNRRAFLDVNLSKIWPEYLELISQYRGLLKERNALLKSDNIDEALLDTLTEMMIPLSEKITKYRSDYINSINAVLGEVEKTLTGEDNSIRIIYQPFVEPGDDYVTKATEAYKESRDKDIRGKVTHMGVHHEDFSLLFRGEDIAIYGSQGQNRISSLALKIAPYFLIKEEDKKPVVVLDDVMSELDEDNKQRLIKLVNNLNQVFISGTSNEIEAAREFVIE